MTIFLAILLAVVQGVMVARFSAKLAWITVVVTLCGGCLIMLSDPDSLQIKRTMNQQWDTIQTAEQANASNQQLIVHELYQDYLHQVEALAERGISWPRLQYTQARALYAIGDLSASIQILSSLYDASQTETQVGYLLAKLLLERNHTSDLAELEKLLKNIERIGGKDFSLLMLKTEYFVATQQIDSAIEALLQAIDYAPNPQARLQVLQYAGILKSQLKPFQPIEVMIDWPVNSYQTGSLSVTAQLEHGPDVPLAQLSLTLDATQLAAGGMTVNLGTQQQVVPSYNLALAAERNSIVKFKVQLTTELGTFMGLSAVKLNEQHKSIKVLAVAETTDVVRE